MNLWRLFISNDHPNQHQPHQNQQKKPSQPSQLQQPSKLQLQQLSPHKNSSNILNVITIHSEKWDFRLNFYLRIFWWIIGFRYISAANTRDKNNILSKKTLLKKKSDITVKLKVGLALLSLLHYLKCISLVCILKVPYRINESEKMQRKWHLVGINEKWHHGCPEFHEAAKIMPIIKIEHRKLIKMQFFNPMKMMVMANSKQYFILH